jgi:hypothetical protein
LPSPAHRNPSCAGPRAIRPLDLTFFHFPQGAVP